MCTFPSWIEKKGEVFFLIDKDVPRGEDIHDYVGHQGLREVFSLKGGKSKEGFPCHPLIAQEIRNGHMKKLAKASDSYTILLVDKKGSLKQTEQYYPPDNFWKDPSETYIQNWKNNKLHGECIEKIGRKVVRYEIYKNGKVVKTILPKE